MKERCCLAVSIFLVIASLMIMASATDTPKFKSGISINAGIDVNFDALYSKANSIYDVVEHDSNHLVWKNTITTGNWNFLSKNGTVVVASTGGLDLSLKDKLAKDLDDVFALIKVAGGTIAGSDQPVYYAENSREYSEIMQPFESDFKLYLNIPNCTVYDARMSVTGSDNVPVSSTNNAVYGQRYYINANEVSGCNIACNVFGNDCAPVGISCGRYSVGYPVWVEVAPVDITKSVLTGLNVITSDHIDNKHTMTIEAITSSLTKPIVLYNDGKTIWVEGNKRSQSIDELYSLIQPTTTRTDYE